MKNQMNTFTNRRLENAEHFSFRQLYVNSVIVDRGMKQIDKRKDV